MKTIRKMKKTLFIACISVLMVGCASSFVLNHHAGKELGWIKASCRTTSYLSETSSSSETDTSGRDPAPSRGPPDGRRPRPDGRRPRPDGRRPRPDGRRPRPDGRRPAPDGRRRGPPGGRPGGGPGGGPPALQLMNPLKLQRVIQEYSPPPRQERGSDGGPSRGPSRGPPQRRSPAGTASTAGVDGSSGDMGPPTVGARRPRGTKQPAEQKWKKAQPNNRNSLRIGTTGKRGRSATKNQRRGTLKRKNRANEKAARQEAALVRKTVFLPDGPMTVSELADLIDEKPVAVIKFLMTDLGVMASMTQSLDPATCVAAVEGLGRVVGGDDDFEEEELEESALSVGFAVDEDDPEDLVTRAPVVTIMGHVDHGKTSLLDAIRNTQVTAGEAGGITQAISAYQVDHKGKKITFIDTPGHAAFTDMRERGANITDIVILVVAADDSVKQQTTDSIICARQAGVPIVVAVNKCDLETADPARVISDLTAYDILTEELGGEVLSSEISAKMNTNLDDLLDKVMLQAELQNLKANPDRNAQGAVIEARVERGLGTLGTTLVQRGTIRVGDYFVAGSTSGKVRALLDTDGKTRLTEAGPSQPVNVVGFDGVPAAGDLLVVVDDEQAARELAESRQRISLEKESAQYQAGLMSSVAAAFSGGVNKEKREMCVVVKADVQGSAEALTRALRELKLEDDESIVTVKVLVSETGEVTKSDIAIASVTPDTTVLAFGVAASLDAMDDARVNGVPMEYYNIM